MQTAIKTILYSTDLSPNAPIAFGYAAYLAKLTGAEVHILHVLERLTDDASFAIQVYIQDSKKRHNMLDLRIERARKLLAEKQKAFWAAQSDEDRNVQSQIKTVTVCEAHPAEEILKAAKKYDCDLIVMGSHEHGFRHSFLGSVARSVLHRSHVPTLIVPLAETD